MTEPKARAEGGPWVITDVWVRADIDLAPYRNRETGLRIAPLLSGIFTFSNPGEGATFSLLTGLQIGDRQLELAPLGGVNVWGTTFRGLAGWRLWAHPTEHVTIWNETLFFIWQQGQRTLSQTEIVTTVGKDHRLELGGKILTDGNTSRPRDDMAVMAGPLLQVWLLPSQHGGDSKRRIKPRLRLDTAYKLGPCWREGHLGLCHEIELELVFLLRN
jgi:hypothetical protein